MASTPVPSRHLPIRPDWLSLVREPILEPELPIVDAHHHLWNRDGRLYGLTELLEDTHSGHNVIATVFVECGAMYRLRGDPAMRPVGEVEFANGVAAMSASGGFGRTRVAAAIVGYADLGLGPRVREVLEAQIAVGGGRFRGVRNISAWHADPAARGSSATPPPDVLTRPSFKEGLACLTELGLGFDAWMYHTQQPELAALARAAPDTLFVMNHVAGPIGIGPYAGKRDEVFTAWRTALQDLAACENVYMKLGGLGMRLFGFDVHEADRPPGSQTLAERWRPYIETCIEAFGPTRCMFESNFPVDKGSCSYHVLWNAFKRITRAASPAEKAALYRDTAREVYRIDLDEPASPF